MNAPGSSDDCYFYFYSSCTKGSDCPYRHCEAALGTEVVCSLWREGRCYRSNCKFRHMESRINRASIPCYWENQPGGCRKPHCVFLHQRSRLSIHNTTESQDLILPVSTSVTVSPTTSKLNDSKEPTKSGIPSTTVDSYSTNSDDGKLSPTFPVEPLVVNFEEGEESDSESVSSTPMKSGMSELKFNSNSVKRNLSERFLDKVEEKDFGIKTLEQIRMEKIHKESEHFYKSDDTSGSIIPNINLEVMRNSTFAGDKMFSFSAYDALVIDSSPIMPKPDSFYKPVDISFKPAADILFQQESYPPKSDFISLSDDQPQDVSTESDSARHPTEQERDLRNRLLKRKANSSYLDKSAPAKKILGLKKGKEDDPLNFKIKTLDEIRRERENKLGNSEENFLNQDPQITRISDSCVPKQPDTLSSKAETSHFNGKSAGRLRIKRQTKDCVNSNVLPEMNSDQVLKKENRSQMVLHEVQNISENQNNGDIKGKRKEIDNSSVSRNSKAIKLDSTPLNSQSSGLVPILNGDQTTCSIDDKSVKKSRRPVINRRRSSASPPSISSQSVPVPEQVEEKNDISSSSITNASVILDNNNSSVIDEEYAVSSTVCEKDSDSKSVRSNSVDEFDSLFLNETDIALDDVEDAAGKGPDDILLEIEQLLES